ncbi:hypothetical protein [Winogradskyella immobilis]|uniref:hypothetical protein n=1 Tax=Winogradskyella immobilis TaxID=2816852 RepID=UPI00389A7480
MNYKSRILNIKSVKTLTFHQRPFVVFSCFFLLFSLFSFSQVTTEVDTTKIRIGEQISYKIKVDTDSTALVVFPEGQTFSPLEVVEAFETDTTKKESRFHLLREYKLTQFDSGSYYIPKQKVVIGEKSFFTDSLRIDVNTVEIDTTKQKLYDIKPIIQVEKSSSKWWLYFLLILAIVAAIAFLLYWFIWRKKPLTEEEEIALLPPYDRAKLALKKLDESQYLIRSELKEYYSELTFIIRKYLDEKVYDRAMESTTDELIERLNLIRAGNQLAIESDTIKNIESILKRADLVKFAKSAPDTVLAEMDKATVDKEIDAVKVVLPEPSEEEKLLDAQYKEEQERKKKTRKIILTAAISVFLLIATFVGFGIKYGFGYVKDTIIGHESKTLLEGDWVNSAYGFPPVYISTPKVLKRQETELPEEVKKQLSKTEFKYGTLLDLFSISINSLNFKAIPPSIATSEDNKDANRIDLIKYSESSIGLLEQAGFSDILVNREQFITPNAAEGLKTSGSFNVNIPESDKKITAEYAMFQFTVGSIVQEIIITWGRDDKYADEMVQRIIDSIELKPDEEEVQREDKEGETEK